MINPPYSSADVILEISFQSRLRMIAIDYQYVIFSLPCSQHRFICGAIASMRVMSSRGIPNLIHFIQNVAFVYRDFDTIPAPMHRNSPQGIECRHMEYFHSAHVYVIKLGQPIPNSVPISRISAYSFSPPTIPMCATPHLRSELPAFQHNLLCYTIL